jgi:hypothetical protein
MIPQCHLNNCGLYRKWTEKHKLTSWLPNKSNVSFLARALLIPQMHVLCILASYFLLIHVTRRNLQSQSKVCQKFCISSLYKKANRNVILNTWLSKWAGNLLAIIGVLALWRGLSSLSQVWSWLVWAVFKPCVPEAGSYVTSVPGAGQALCSPVYPTHWGLIWMSLDYLSPLLTWRGEFNTV